MEPEAILAIAGVIIAGLLSIIGVLLRQRRNNSQRKFSGNPGLPSCAEASILVGEVRHMQEKLEEVLREMTRMRTILEERLPRP